MNGRDFFARVQSSFFFQRPAMDQKDVDMKEASKVFHGPTNASKVVDGFVSMHFVFAFAFASLAMFYPQIFGFFANDASSFEEGTYAADAVRWSSPFIYGFSFFAISSLYADAVTRRTYAKIYVAAFSIATAVGFYTQFNGRWNALHALNIALFASLALGYGILLTCLPDGFDRSKLAKEI